MPDRLRAFLSALPREYRYALEFRDPSWFNQEAYRLLTDHGAAFCIYEFAGQLSPKEITANLFTSAYMGLVVPIRETMTPKLWLTGQRQSPLGPVKARKCSVTLTMMKPGTPLKML